MTFLQPPFFCHDCETKVEKWYSNTTMLGNIYEFAMCICLKQTTKTWYVVESKAMYSQLRDFLFV
jgi:hypothetical protein